MEHLRQLPAGPMPPPAEPVLPLPASSTLLSFLHLIPMPRATAPAHCPRTPAGVSEGNWRALMREVDSLAELAGVPLERLTTIVGGQAAAKKLREFLSQECKALFSAL